MLTLFPCFTVVENLCEGPVEFRECPSYDPEGTSCPVTRLRPRVRRLILAGKYRQHCVDSGFPRTIQVCSDGACFNILKPDDFICNGRITVRTLNGHKLVHRTTRPTLRRLFNRAIGYFQRNINCGTKEPM